MDEEKPAEQRPQRIITDREKLYLSVGDILMILTILVDLLYLSDVIQIAGNDLLTLNVLAVSISFVVYQLKKRVRKRAARELAEKKKAEEA